MSKQQTSDHQAANPRRIRPATQQVERPPDTLAQRAALAQFQHAHGNPHALPPSTILALQRVVGNAAVNQLLGRHRPEAGLPKVGEGNRAPHTQRMDIPAASAGIVVQRARTALTTKEILAALKKIPFMKGKLATTLHEEKMEEHVTAALRGYKEHFAKKTNEDINTRDAMMLSMALDGVARVIVEEINDPSVQPVVASKLLELYRAEVETKIKGQNRSLKNKDTARGQVMTLTAALLSGDPVTQYMHREIRVEQAAAQIQSMADKAKVADATMTPLRMFELMEQRFQVQMAAFSKDQLQEDVQDARFSTRETAGEYSTYFFQQTFGDNAFGNDDSLAWEKGGKGKPDRLTFTEDAEERLAELRSAVQLPAVVADIEPREGVTERQEQHLAELEENEKEIDKDNIKENFVEFFMERYVMLKSAAEALYGEVGKVLTSSPLTITVKADKWFGGAAAPDPNFKPAAARKARTPLSTVFGKATAVGTLEHLPTWDDTGLPEEEKRGAKYLRFRAWKDQLLTGLHGFTAEEMPVFGALNVNWETSRGGDAPDRPGTNYYGDLHFILSRDTIKDRLIHTATDHGAPRRDPMLALNDFTFGGRGVTWLKDTKKLAVIDNVVNAARTKAPIYGLPLVFEVQIFGGINIKEDVEEVYLAPSVPAPLAKKVTDFYADTEVAVKRTGDTPPNAITTSGGDINPIDMMRMVQGAELPEDQTEETEAAAEGLGPYQKGMVTAAYTLAFHIKQTATSFGDVMTPEDFATFTQALVRLKGLSAGVAGQQVVAAEAKERLKTLVTQAEQALQRAQGAKQPVLVGSL